MWPFKKKVLKELPTEYKLIELPNGKFLVKRNDGACLDIANWFWWWSAEHILDHCQFRNKHKAVERSLLFDKTVSPF